jgi:hypothetical protein
MKYKYSTLFILIESNKDEEWGETPCEGGMRTA